jgi:hypothetical protein
MKILSHHNAKSYGFFFSIKIIVLFFLFFPILLLLLLLIYVCMYLMCCISKFLWFLSFPIVFSIFYYDVNLFYVFILHFLFVCFFLSLVMVFCGCRARVTIKYI